MGLFASQIFASQLERIVLQDEQDRIRRMDAAWAAYYGHTPDPLKVKPGQPNDNVKPNKARVVVDKGVSFLFGDDVSFKLPDSDKQRGEDPDQVDPAQVWLDACLAANKQMTLLHKLALQGGVCGHVFVRFDERGAGVDETFPRLTLLDPATVRVTWDPHDIERVTEYVIQYAAEDPETRRVTNYRQVVLPRGDGWVSIDQQTAPDATTWQTTATTPWPHPYPPIVACQNLPAPNEFWGIPDLSADVLALQGALAFARSNAQRIIRFHASPKTVAKGIGGNQIDVSVDNVIVLPNPDASLENLEMQSDLASTEAHIDGIEQDIHEVARIPSISTGTLDSIGPLSGVALQILYQPLVEKTKTKRRLYGDLLVELCRRLLDLAGHGNANVVTISWPELLPGDPLQERQVYQLEDQLGVVSKRTIAERLGLDWEIEQERMAAERQSAADAMAQQQQAAGGLPTQVVPGQLQPPANLTPGKDAGMRPQGTS